MKKLFYVMAMLFAAVCLFTSCEPEKEKETATVTFWTDDDEVEEIIEVNLYKADGSYDQYRDITQYYTSGSADCGDSGCANFYDVEYGKYYFYAENSSYEWKGEMDINLECKTMKLYVSKANAKSNQPDPSSITNKIEPAVMDFDMNNILK